MEDVQQPQLEVLVEFVPRPLPVQVDSAQREVGVVTHRKGKSFLKQKSNFLDPKSRIAEKCFINSFFLEVDLQWARDEMDSNDGGGMVKHALEVGLQI